MIAANFDQPTRQMNLQVSERSGAGPSNGKGCRILLVEDDITVAELYATVLRLNDHAVTIAADGVAGLEAMRSGSFDIILLDIRMPRMDGLAMLRTALGESGTVETPVLILTNYDDPNLRQQAMELGARDYLLKSRTMPHDLAAQVARWCA
jgi:CheY-like chemotaxis protein